MKNYIINNIISGNEVYHRKMEYTCSLCKSDKLSDSIFQKRDIKALLNLYFKKKSHIFYFCRSYWIIFLFTQKMIITEFFILNTKNRTIKGII